MRIQFEIKEKLEEILNEILHSDKWETLIKEDIPGRKLVAIKDLAYGSEANIEIYAREIFVRTAWSNYIYHFFLLGDSVWCEYTGAYRGLLEQQLLPTVTPKESLLDSEVLDSTLYKKDTFGHQRKLREYAEENVKLKNLKQSSSHEPAAPFDHPRKVYDEFIKEDYIPCVLEEEK